MIVEVSLLLSLQIEQTSSVSRFPQILQLTIELEHHLFFTYMYMLLHTIDVGCRRQHMHMHARVHHAFKANTHRKYLLATTLQYS